MSERALRTAGRAIERRDRVTVRLDASTTVRHPNGWVDAWGVATRSGVLAYPEHGTNEYRPPEEVFEPGSLSTLRGVPLTLDHPEALVDSSNVRDLTHGWVLQVVPAEPDVRVQVRLASDAALAEVSRGTLELSCGYLADYAEEPGTAPDGTAYTGVQRRIRYNHLALVQLARAGHAARLTLDSKRGRMLSITIRKQTRPIPKFIADAIGAEAAAFAGRRTDADTIETEEISLRGTTLVLPKEMVDALVAALGIGSAGAPAEPPATDEAPTEPPPPQNPPPGEGPRMDAKAEARIRAIVREEISLAAREQSRTDAIVARATKLLEGKVPTGLDTFALMACAIERCDSARAAEVKRLATDARKGDARAAGMLEGLLAISTAPRADAAPGEDEDEEEQPDAAAERTDAPDHVAAAVQTLDNGRRDQAQQQRTDSSKPSNFDAERNAARERKLAHGKPPTTTQPAAPAK